MAKRRRYNTLLRVIGDPWLLFTVTASDQVHIDEVNGTLDLQRTSVNLKAHPGSGAVHPLECDGGGPTCRAELSVIRHQTILVR